MSTSRPPKQGDLVTSALGRLFKIGMVATRVGTSLATEQALGFLRGDPFVQARRTENFMLNALRVTEALGELKGAAMKVGQMLSVHEGLFPPEVLTVLRNLQNQAPRVPFEQMRAVLEAEVPDFATHFVRLEPQAIAAASIGQVYRGQLADGRDVAVKIQYPDIDRVVRSDLKNLKKLFGSLVAMVAEVDFDEIWEELKERLLEELDYVQEAENMTRMRALHAGTPEVVIPELVPEASGRRVLTMTYVPGISPEDACSDSYTQSQKNVWGANLLTFVIRGLVEHEFLHADPNFANYAFREDGSLVVYDHGCVKRIPPALALHYRHLLRALIDQDMKTLPGRLLEMGVYNRRTGAPLPQKLLEPIAREAMEIVGPEPFRFSRRTDIYDILLSSKVAYAGELSSMALPPDLVFVNRTLSGLFGNLCRLEAEGQWRAVLEPFASAATGSAAAPV
jgi:predicted unusual protein kinase regulating ubiquinone biosynthesis (AarF/ABC1/UbiB family)